MKRVWKPLDVGGLRLYKVTLEHFYEGKQVYGNHVDPLLIMATSPRNAAALASRIYNEPDNPIRTECYGKAVKILMPESWWENGVPCIHDLEVQYGNA